MDLAVLRITGLVETGTGAVQLSHDAGASGFFAHALQSFIEQLGGLPGREGNGPWGPGVEPPSLTASLSFGADSQSSDAGTSPELPVSLSGSGEAATTPPGWYALLAISGEMGEPQGGETASLVAEEGKSRDFMPLLPVFHEVGSEPEIPVQESSDMHSQKRSGSLGGMDGVRHAPQHPLGAVEPEQALLLEIARWPVAAAPLDGISQGVDSEKRSGAASVEAIPAVVDPRGFTPKIANAPGAGPRGPVLVPPEASALSGVVETPHGAVQVSQGAGPEPSDAGALSRGLEYDPKVDLGHEGPLVTAAMPRRRDIRSRAPSQGLSSGNGMSRIDGQDAPVLQPGDRSEGTVPGFRETAVPFSTASDKVSPAFNGTAEGEQPSSLDEGVLSRAELGARPVNRATDTGFMESRALSDGAVRPEISAGRLLEQIESRLQRMVLKGRETVLLQLEPESLGRLKMEVSLGDHGVTAKMTTESLAVRELIFNHVHTLKEALLDQGFRVENIQVDYREETADPGFRDGNQTYDHGPRQQLRDEGEEPKTSSHEDMPSPGENDLPMAAGRVNVFA